MPRRGPSRSWRPWSGLRRSRAVGKATTGWLNPDLKCTYGHLATNYLVTGRETWAAKLALPNSIRLVLEGGRLGDGRARARRAAGRAPASFVCLVLALVTVFHVGVMLLFDISFRVNVIAYGAFVRYADLPVMASLGARPVSRKLAVRRFRRGLRVRTDRNPAGRGLVGTSLDEIIVGIGGLVGVVYLLRGCARVARRFRFQSIADKRPLVGNRRPESRAAQSARRSERTVDQWGCRVARSAGKSVSKAVTDSDAELKIHKGRDAPSSAMVRSKSSLPRFVASVFVFSSSRCLKFNDHAHCRQQMRATRESTGAGRSAGCVGG